MNNFIKIIICTIFLMGSPSKINDLAINSNFWKVEKHNDIWWFVSPEGNKEFLTLVNTVRFEEKSHKEPHYIAKNKNLSERVLNYGFKGLDAWASPELYNSNIPFCKDLNISKYIHPHFILTKEWENVVSEVIRNQVIPLANNKNLIGYYLDNELYWDYICEKSTEKYFSFITSEIRKYDKNHLILGVRFNHIPPDYVLEISKKYIDVHSINNYNQNFSFIEYIHSKTALPIIISEFSFYSKDGRSGNTNSNWWWGGNVKDQSERAAMYEKTVISFAKKNFIIGASWFQWNDQPPEGRILDGENVNFGVVDIFDIEYIQLIESIRRTSNIINKIHKQQ